MIEHQQPTEHAQFDSLCEGLEEYDALPTAAAASPEPADREHGDHEEPGDEALDGQILAGLVSPL